MQNRYNILQSGFISLENKHLISPEAQEGDMEFDAYILNMPYKTNDNKFFYHRLVSDVYDEYNKDQRVSMSFEFQEKAIKAFIDALSVPSFAMWIELQNENPLLTAIQQRFIYDTLDFISGRGRKMSVETWDMLIDRENAFNKQSANKFEVSKYFTNGDVQVSNGLGIYQTFKVPYALPLMLQRWISMPMGFSDFIVTANIIFGRKLANKTVI